MDNKVKRRDFLQIVSASTLIAATGLPLATLASESTVKTSAIIGFLSKPYLQNPAHDGMSIMWLTDSPCYSWIEFSEQNGKPQKAYKVTNGLVDANDRIHKIRLKNLKPGTKYTYKVFSKEITQYDPYKIVYGKTIESDAYEFSTPALYAKEVSVLILNDIHDRPQSIPLLLNLNNKDPFDFVFLNGDMFNYQKDEHQIVENLLNPCASVFSANKPFMFIRGNHETRGEFSRNLATYFENIDNGNYFAFTYGPVHFITLDTGEDKEDTHPVYAGMADFDHYREQQAIWLEQQLKSKAYKKAKFKVIFMHIPPFHSGDWHGTMHCRKLFVPLFNKYKVDIVISGHTHKYGVHEPQEGHDFPIIIGGGPQDTKRTLTRFHADEKSLNIVMIRDDGEVVGKYTINA